MNAEIFCEHFATFAEAPSGVDKLRELILQLAVRGQTRCHKTTNSEPVETALVKSPTRGIEFIDSSAKALAKVERADPVLSSKQLGMDHASANWPCHRRVTMLRRPACRSANWLSFGDLRSRRNAADLAMELKSNKESRPSQRCRSMTRNWRRAFRRRDWGNWA